MNIEIETSFFVNCENSWPLGGAKFGQHIVIGYINKIDFSSNKNNKKKYLVFRVNKANKTGTKQEQTKQEQNKAK